MDAEGVAVEGDGDGLVERDPLRHPVTEPLAGGRAVLGEPLRRGPVHPAAAVLEGQRRVPVVQRGHGGDAGGQQQVHQPVVEVQAPLLNAPRPVRLDPGPGDREPVGVDAEFAHERDVFRRAVVVVAGDRRGVPVEMCPASRQRHPSRTGRGRRRRGRPRSGRRRSNAQREVRAQARGEVLH